MPEAVGLVVIFHWARVSHDNKLQKTNGEACHNYSFNVHGKYKSEVLLLNSRARGNISAEKRVLQSSWRYFEGGTISLMTRLADRMTTM